MNRWRGGLTASCVLILVSSYAWTHRDHMADVVASRSAPIAEQVPATYAEAREAQQAVTMTGPMANYMARQKPSNVETLQPLDYKAVASDHVGGSPVGTSSAILHQTFGVVGIVNLPFEVPAHASNPQLRGTYRSFLKQAGVKQAGAESSDADVEFLLLSEQQYGEFLNGRPSEPVFSAEDAHNQEVNTALPPTRDQPAKYYLVFRNNRHELGKIVVQADFRVDF
jgi:hypothetical protein